MTDLPSVPSPAPAINPIELTDPASLTLLFEMDPSTVERPAIDAVIRELRLRADSNRAAVAAAQAAPKTPKKVGKAGTNQVSLAAAAISDKPIADLALDDLFDDDTGTGLLD